MNAQTKNRLTLIGIAAMFAVPVVSAWFVNKNPELIEGRNTKNYGELFRPAVPIELEFYVEAAHKTEVNRLNGRWALIHVDADGLCEKNCQQSVFNMHQLNVLLNKDSERLKRVMLYKANIDQVSGQAWHMEDKGLKVFQWEEKNIPEFNEQIKGLVDGDMLLMDPLGNILMKYPEDADPYGVQRDIKLLFKASQIG
jgi:hypothetical protein